MPLFRHRNAPWLGLCAVLWRAVAQADPAAAPTAAPTDERTEPTERYSLHAQITSVTQRQGAFRSPYQGDNSLTPERAQKETADVTFYLGLRLWSGAGFYLNPEIDQGYGLSNTLGVAGFPSGEAYKVGKNAPYWKVPRLFLRQVVNLGGGEAPVEAGPNALAGTVTKDRLTVTIGKFGVGDVFDGNTHAHDPRSDFLNWSIVDAGAFDYAADAWGFTHGAAAEWQTGDWTVRGGLFALSEVPNSTHIDKGFGQRSYIAEIERRHDFAGRPGAARLLVYRNDGRMGRYDDAVRLAALNGGVPDTAQVRQRASKSGWALNLEQALAPEAGAFLRWSASTGDQEAFEFTEINRSLSGGVSLKGALWGWPGHTWGTAYAVNTLSAAAIGYFRAGGIGILIGDGQLPHAGNEQILESYYRIDVGPYVAVTADFQRITNPAYNRDRGPVNIVGLRLHAEF